MNRNIVTAFASIFAGRMTVMVALALTTPLLIRILGVQAYGEYAAVISVFTLLMILVSSGINSGVRKYISEEREDPQWKSHVFGFYFRLAGLLSLVAAVGFVGAAWSGLVEATLGASVVPYFYLIGILAVLEQFTNYLRRSLMGLKLEHVAEPIRVSFTLVFSVSAIALAWAGYGVAGVLVGRMIACGVVIVASSYVLAREVSIGAIRSSVPSWFPRRELFSFNYQTIIYVFLLTSLYHVDVIMLGMSVPSDQVGYYKAALVLAEFLWVIPRAIQSTMIQSTSNLWAQGDVDRINEIASRVTRYTVLLTLLLCIGIASLANTFVPIYYPSDFTASVQPLLLLLPGALGFAIARPVLSISHAKGDMQILILATAGAAGINLGLNALLIPQYEMIGAAVATSIGYGSLPVFHVLGARYLGFNPFADARLGRIAVTAGLSAIPIVGLAWWLTEPIVALVLVPPVGFIVYSLLAVVTGAIHLDEVYEIVSALPAPVGSQATMLLDRFNV